jgi:hypothetical protein
MEEFYTILGAKVVTNCILANGAFSPTVLQRIGGKIGGGGMAAVCRATYTKLKVSFWV